MALFLGNTYHVAKNGGVSESCIIAATYLHHRKTKSQRVVDTALECLKLTAMTKMRATCHIRFDSCGAREFTTCDNTQQTGTMSVIACVVCDPFW